MDVNVYDIRVWSSYWTFENIYCRAGVYKFWKKSKINSDPAMMKTIFQEQLLDLITIIVMIFFIILDKFSVTRGNFFVHFRSATPKLLTYGCQCVWYLYSELSLNTRSWTWWFENLNKMPQNIKNLMIRGIWKMEMEIRWEVFS